MRKLWNISDEIPDDLKHFLLAIPRELLHKILQKQITVFNQEIPDNLKQSLLIVKNTEQSYLIGHLIDSYTIRINCMVI